MTEAVKFRECCELSKTKLQAWICSRAAGWILLFKFFKNHLQNWTYSYVLEGTTFTCTFVTIPKFKGVSKIIVSYSLIKILDCNDISVAVRGCGLYPIYLRDHPWGNVLLMCPIYYSWDLYFRGACPCLTSVLGVRPYCALFCQCSCATSGLSE